jgi:hypothetical protein
VHMFSPAPCSQTSSVYVPPLTSELKFHPIQKHGQYYANEKTAGAALNCSKETDFNLIISSWIKIWFVTDVPEYLNCDTLSSIFLSLFWPAIMWRGSNKYIFSTFTPRPASFLAKIKVAATSQSHSVALSPQANYTDWSTATCRWNLVPTFVDRRVSRGQCGGSPRSLISVF